MKCKKNKQEKYKNISCPSCNSVKIIRRGFRQTDNRGKIQRFSCRNCSKRFIVDDGFFRMRNAPHKVTLCMDLFYKGVSTRKVQEHLQSFYPKNSSHMSVYRWIVKYANMISSFTDKLNIDIGIELMSDEMEYHRLGEQNWFVDVMDTTTRFMVSSDYVKSRTNDNLIKVLKKAREKTGEAVKIVTTDALNGYPAVLRKTFSVNSKFKHGERVIHNIVKADERGFNHKIERLHNTIRDRTKIMRGFHGCIESANSIMKGMEIYYNFVRKHQAIDARPYEKAIPSLQLSNNKWLDLIYLSKEVSL